MSIHEKNNNNLAGQTGQFSSPHEEIAFLKIKLEETQTEFVEFQESSRELEVEYETQVKQLEKKNNEYLNQINRLEVENEQLRTKYSVYTNDTQHKLNEYQQQITDLTALNDRLTSYIRELEQNNDDLERARRALAASLEDFEGQLNQQIERNVLLENEVSEKEELECVVQRLKEEARDLRHELIVNKNSNDSVRRRQLNIDNHQIQSNAQVETPSLQSINSNTLSNNKSAISSEQQSNSEAVTGFPSSVANCIDQTRPPMVDSTTSPPQSPSQFSFSPPSISSDKSLDSTSKNTDSKSQQTSAPSSPATLPSSMVMSPSSRISALNIVSDLLRKVGALESKLATAKKVTN